MPALKKITRTSTTKTEMIVDENGQTFIIDRTNNVQTHSELIDNKETHTVEYRKWVERDKLHREEMKRDQEQPSLVRQAEEGEQYALKMIVEPHKDDKEGAIGIKNIWWDAVLNWIKDQALGYIIGALRGLVKDNIPNMVKFADWLVENLESLIVNQWKQIGDEETRGLIRNELNQYPPFKRLVDKMIL